MYTVHNPYFDSGLTSLFAYSLHGLNSKKVMQIYFLDYPTLQAQVGD